MRQPPVFMRRRLALSLGVLLCSALGLLASCKEPTALAAPAPDANETAVHTSARSKAALSGSVSVDAITIETRFWDSAPYVMPATPSLWNENGVFPTGLGAVNAFNGLPRMAAGYTNTPVALPSLACAVTTPGLLPGQSSDAPYGTADKYTGCVQNPGDGVTALHSNVATRYRVRITASTATRLAVRFGVDFMGGVMLVDGAVVGENWGDPWWNGYFVWENGALARDGVTYKPLWETDPTATISATISNWAAGSTHIIEVVGFENSSDGGAAAQINLGGGWQNVVANVPSQVALNAGNNQTAVVGGAVAVPPSVIVKDASGNPVAGVTVTFEVLSGGGSLTGASPVTSSAGIATVGSWTLGAAPGLNTMRALAAGLSGSPVTLSATGTSSDTPSVYSCVATPSRLWPANHKMVGIGVSLPAGSFMLDAVTSNEPDDAKEKSRKDEGNDAVGDGNTVNDIQGWVLHTAAVTGQLRAERAGHGSGRIYTLTYRGSNVAGHSATASCTVTVPLNNKDK